MHFQTQISNSDGKGYSYAARLLSKLVSNSSTSISEHNCKSYLLFYSETNMGNGIRTCLYVLGLLYCFFGLSAITGCFFRSMAKVVQQTRKVVTLDPDTGIEEVTRERIWNYTLADISLLAFGTSFPQISLAIIDAFQNLGQLYAGGLGPATLVGSAAFDLYPIHAVCVVIPRAGTVKKISDLGVWLVELLWSFWAYIWLYIIVQMEDYETRKNSGVPLRSLKIFWRLINFPWRILFAFVPPCDIAHGWLAFIVSLGFITGISYVLTKLTDLISCVTGINPYVIAFTALASGTSWPDMVASKIAAERQTTADSAIANITCSNSANLFIGIGVPWLIGTVYNRAALGEVLLVHSDGLSFSLVIFFITFFLCMLALVLRRYIFGGELGGPRLWAWITCVYLMLLWVAFVLLSSLKVSNII